MGGEKLDGTVPSSGFAKRQRIKPRGVNKRPCGSLWGHLRPIGSWQRKHVVIYKSEKARRGFYANENIDLFDLMIQVGT